MKKLETRKVHLSYIALFTRLHDTPYIPIYVNNYYNASYATAVKYHITK